jgi:hypothetical protein
MRNRNPLGLGRFQNWKSTGTAGLVNVLEVAQENHTSTMQTSHFGHEGYSYFFLGFIPGSNLGAGLGDFIPGAPAPGIILGAPAPGIIGMEGAPPIGGNLGATLPVGN